MEPLNIEVLHTLGKLMEEEKLVDKMRQLAVDISEKKKPLVSTEELVKMVVFQLMALSLLSKQIEELEGLASGIAFFKAFVGKNLQDGKTAEDILKEGGMPS